LSPIVDFARSLCALVPGLAERIEVVQRTTRFDHVTVPLPAFAISREAYVAFKELCESMAERAVPSREPMSEQPVYLSRAGLGLEQKRMVLGEARLERFFEGQGFRIVRPETLPVCEQIAIVNRHKWIVAPMGSACHTRLFSRRPTNLLMLIPNRMRPNFVLCDLLSEGVAHYANVFSIPPGLESESTAVRSMVPKMLDEERLLILLKEFGLVRATAAFDSPRENFEALMRSPIDAARRRAERQAKRKADTEGL
jgi:hypothetical protein